MKFNLSQSAIKNSLFTALLKSVAKQYLTSISASKTRKNVDIFQHFSATLTDPAVTLFHSIGLPR